MYDHLPPKSQLAQSLWNSAIGTRHRIVCLFLQWMRLVSEGTVGVYNDIPGEGSPLYVRSKSKRTTTSSFVLDGVDSCVGIRFTRTGGAYNSINRFAE
jgi:hypothetical protein